jgi:hypothetical protein
MHTERQWQGTENRIENAEVERQLCERNRTGAERQREVNDNKRQVGEKLHEVGEQLQETEGTGEQLVVEYSTHALLTRIEGIEEQLSQLASRLGSVEALLKAMQQQLQQIMTDK